MKEEDRPKTGLSSRAQQGRRRDKRQSGEKMGKNRVPWKLTEGVWGRGSPLDVPTGGCRDGGRAAGRRREHTALHKALSRPLLSVDSGQSPGVAVWSITTSRSLDLSAPGF